jgi:hypothetical protein
MTVTRTRLIAAIATRLDDLDGPALNSAYALLTALNQDGDGGELRELAAAGHLDGVPAWLREHGWLTDDFELGPVARFALGKANVEPAQASETTRLLLSYLGL